MAITFKFELNSKPKADSTHGILLRITENRKLKRLSTGIFIKPEDFNKNADYGKWIRKSNSKHEAINNELETFIDDAKNAKANIKNQNQVPTAKNIIQKMNQKNNKQEGTLDFLQYWSDLLPDIHQTYSVEFHRNCQSKLSNLKSYMKDNDLPFDKLDSAFLHGYISYMKKKGNGKNTIAANLKMIRIIYYIAFNLGSNKKKLSHKRLKNLDELKYENPFKEIEIKEESANKNKLSEQEVRSLIQLYIKDHSDLWNVRNYFLFAMYCAGMRIRDLMQLKWSDVKNNQMNYKMKKNNKIQMIQLLPEALQILNKYKSDKVRQSDYIFPILDSHAKYDRDSIGKAIRSNTAIINLKLKQLAELAGIEANLSTHISRHTFATIASQKGIDSYNLQKLLRHSSLKQTETYLEQLNNDAANKALQMFKIE
jgi:integrase/recombinase XerD